jgi:AraC family transcriptional regulator
MPSPSSLINLSSPPEVVQMGIGVHGRSAGVSTEIWRLPHLWCLHIYHYEARLELNGLRFDIRPGTATLVPPNTEMRYRFRGSSEHVYCHFKTATSENATPCRWVFEPSPANVLCANRMRLLATNYSGNFVRQQATLWDVLWELCQEYSQDHNVRIQHHPSVRQAINLIESRLSQNISIASLTEELGISYGYLSRLFQAEFDTNVVSYIRHRRGELAEHLLMNTTLSIKTIANSVGMPNLQMFNRMIHKTLGNSPKAIRDRNQPIT